MIASVSALGTLRHYKSQLDRMQVSGDKEVSRLMALAECHFRLSVHPDTTPEDAIGLLQDAVRSDGSNPKYAYHLARLEFRRGRLQHAARWYRIACCLAPTSHRIWVHVALLLRELNESYKGDERYEPNVLLSRSESILKEVRAGRDSIDPALLDFIPPQSLAAKEQELRQGKRAAPGDTALQTEQNSPTPTANVRRYEQAGVCRWSGIDQLYIEQVLEGRATQSNVKRLMPTLQQLAETSLTRAGQPAAVAILLVQWVLCGYPVESVRRLAQFLPRWLPSRCLLDTVCELYETPLSELPDHIARAVESGMLPALIGSLIHRERLLWRPLEWGGGGAFRDAQRLLADQRGDKSSEPPSEEVLEEIREVAKRLESAIDSFLGDSPKQLTDYTPPIEHAQAAATTRPLLEQFRDFEQAVVRLGNLKEEAFRLLKEDLEPRTTAADSPDAAVPIAIDHRLAEQFLELLASQTTACLERFEDLCRNIAASPGLEPGADFSTRREECIASLQGLGNLGKFVKVLRRIAKQIERLVPPADAAGAPSATWSALIAGVQSVLPSADSTAPDVVAPPSTGNLLHKLLDCASELTAIREALSERIRTHFADATAPDAASESRLQAAVDSAFSDGLLKAIADCGSRGLEQAEALRNEAAHTAGPDRPEDFDSQIEQCIAGFRDAMNLGALKRRLIKAARPFSDIVLPEPPPAPSPPLADLLSRLEQLFPASHMGPAVDGQPAIPAAGDATPAAAPADETAAGVAPTARVEVTEPQRDRTPLENLAAIVQRSRRSIDREFEAAEAALCQYPRWIQRLPPYQLLLRFVRGRHAEILYRLGRRRAARTLWNRMLCEDRLDAPVLKNMATADTVEGDAGRYLQSWKEYLELLYYFDIVGENPRQHALLRVQLHRALGNAYAPACLSQKLGSDWDKTVEAAPLLMFLGDRGRMRNLVHHRLLEYFNSRFCFDSPALTLGIKRIEAEANATAACKTISDFAESLADLIPSRVARPFLKLATRTFDEAAKACADTRRMTLENSPNYAAEETQQIETLARIFDFNLKLILAFRADSNLVKNISSLDFLAELAALDRIPLEISPEIYLVVAQTIVVPPDALRDLASILRQDIVVALLKFLLAEGDEAESKVRQRQYEVLTGPWLRSSQGDDLRRIVDGPPVDWMPPAAKEAFQNTAAEDQRLVYLRRWNDLFPAMAHYCWLLANVLMSHSQFDEAYERLERTRHAAVHHPTRRHLHYLMVQILLRRLTPLMDSEQFEQALDVGFPMIELDDCQPALILQILYLYNENRSQTGRTHRTGELRSAIGLWLVRAEREAATPDDSLPVPTPEQFDEVRKRLGEVLK